MTLYIFGAGGGTKELLESKECLCPQVFKKIKLIEDNPNREFLFDIPIISMKDFNNEDVSSFDWAFISCSDPKFKERIDKAYPNLSWISFAHRNCDCLLKDIGIGNWFGYGTHIPSDLKVGRHVRVNYNGVFGHDCEIGDYSFIGINATVCATTKIGKGVYVGSNAVIINKHLTIGDFSIIGAGSVVTKNVPENVVVMGIPARVIRKIDKL